MVGVDFVGNASLVRNCRELSGAWKRHLDRAFAIGLEEGQFVPCERTYGAQFGRYYAGHAAGVGVFGFSGFPGARHGIAQVESFHGVGEIGHEVAPAEFAIGEDVESEFLLLGENAPNLAILYLREGLGFRAAPSLPTIQPASGNFLLGRRETLRTCFEVPLGSN